MKTRIALLVPILAFSLAVIPQFALADEAYDKVPPGLVLKTALSLNDEQAEDLRLLIKARSEEVGTIKGEIDELKAQLEALLKGDSPDPVQVGELVLDIQALKEEKREGREQYHQSFHEILTPRQMNQLGHIKKIALADRAAEVLRDLGLR